MKNGKRETVLFNTINASLKVHASDCRMLNTRGNKNVVVCENVEDATKDEEVIMHTFVGYKFHSPDSTVLREMGAGWERVESYKEACWQKAKGGFDSVAVWEHYADERWVCGTIICETKSGA